MPLGTAKRVDSLTGKDRWTEIGHHIQLDQGMNLLCRIITGFPTEKSHAHNGLHLNAAGLKQIVKLLSYSSTFPASNQPPELIRRRAKKKMLIQAE